MGPARLKRDLALALASYRAHLDEVRQGLVPAAPHDPGNGLRPLVDRRTVEWLLGALGPEAPREARAEAEHLDREFDAFEAERPGYWNRLRADLEALAETLRSRGVAASLLSSEAEFLQAVAERTYLQILLEALEARGLPVERARETLQLEEPGFRAFVERHWSAGLRTASVDYAPARYWWLHPPPEGARRFAAGA